MLCRPYIPCESAKVVKTLTISPPRGAKCNFPIAPEVLRPRRRLPFGVPPGAPKSCEIAMVRSFDSKVRPRASRKATKCAFGWPRVQKVAKREPKRRQNGDKMMPKITLFQKSVECEFDPLFTIYKPHRDLPKTSLIPSLGRVKRGCAPCGASNAAPVLKNDA